MNNNLIIPVAYAMHASPKRYALLLGAGISVSAGLPTASDISANLILAIAKGRGEQIERVRDNDLYLAWFKDIYGESATFKRLMEELGIFEGNRKDGLKKYIYQSHEEGNPVPVVPTEAHRAIARLVKSGMLSLIITTNFDTLMEEALKGENVPYEVVTEETNVTQMSIFPDRCRVLKVNGDFERGMLRITPEDLKEYPQIIEDYLKRIFKEYGLLICGWSGGYDTHLSDILCDANITRQYPVFWCLRNGVSVPSEVCRTLMPNGIDIDNADDFFTTLEVIIERFSRFEPVTTLSAAAAVRKVRDAFRDPRPDLILSDLINTETDRVYQELASGNYLPKAGKIIVPQDHCKKTLEEFEMLTGPLAAMTAMVAYFDDGIHADLVADTIERLINIPLSNSKVEYMVRGGISPTAYWDYLIRLCYYPALLVIYATGIAAVKKGNMEVLEAILARPKISTYFNFTIQKVPFHDRVNIWYAMVFEPSWIIDFSYDRYGRKVNVHYYLYRVIQSILQPIMPNELAYDGGFDIFEYLFGLSYLDQVSSSIEGKSSISPPHPLISRVWVNTVGFNRSGEYRFPDMVLSYLKDIEKKMEGSNFFSGDHRAFQKKSQEFTIFFGIQPPDQTEI